jgi:tetratricopeptide (TPR) repeat protein
MAFGGAAVGALVALAAGVRPLWGALPGFVSGGVGFFVVAHGFAESVGRLGARLIYSTGSGTPRRSGYSLAEALLARGQVDEAIITYRVHVEEAPSDAEPCLRLARIFRDHLGENEEAATWFRRGLGVADDPGVAHLALRELVELLVERVGDPALALPELARFAEDHEETAAGEWAARELAALRKVVWD